MHSLRLVKSAEAWSVYFDEFNAASALVKVVSREDKEVVRVAHKKQFWGAALKWHDERLPHWR